MDKELIAKQESVNDGQSIFLHYDKMAGAYFAFGLSAYYSTMITEPFMSYSDEMDIPVAILRKEHVLTLRMSMEIIEHRSKEFYHLQMTRPPVGDAGYDKWAHKIKEKHYATKKK